MQSFLISTFNLGQQIGRLGWIVDYKNSKPEEGEELARFLQRESDHYREQLALYARAIQAMGDEPIRCALYFTALGKLHTLDDSQVATGN